MDSASLTSLTPILDGIDKWVELAPLLPVIISLELVLSADNAIALASITRTLKNIETQRFALNLGIGISLVLRIILILMAQYLLKIWIIQFLAGLYLLSLFLNKIRKRTSVIQDVKFQGRDSSSSLFGIVVLLALTDLAFSIDSVAAAVAISDQLLLVVTGALIGVIALRFTSGLFIRWLEEYTRLEFAGFIAVGLVGIKLIVLLLLPNILISEQLIFFLMFLIFAWGFSLKESKNQQVK